MYETYFDKLQPFLDKKIFNYNFIDCESFVLSIKTQNTTNDPKNLEFLK